MGHPIFINIRQHRKSCRIQPKYRRVQKDGKGRRGNVNANLFCIATSKKTCRHGHAKSPKSVTVTPKKTFFYAIVSFFFLSRFLFEKSHGWMF